MTQSTEQLHQLLALVLTELDRKAIPIAYIQDIDHKGKAFIEQAARSAPAVPVPQSIEQMAVDRYKVVPSHSSMFYPCAVVAGDGQQQLYIGREVECQNMARKFTGAFLDGAFVALAAAPQPPEADHIPDAGQMVAVAVPVQMPEPDAWRYTDARSHFRYRGRRVGFAAEYPLLKPEPLYTEQQVRDLLTAAKVERKPLTADEIKEPKNGDSWRVEWWNESCRMMLPADKALDSFRSYKNGTMQFTLKQRAHGVGNT